MRSVTMLLQQQLKPTIVKRYALCVYDMKKMECVFEVTPKVPILLTLIKSMLYNPDLRPSYIF